MTSAAREPVRGRTAGSARARPDRVRELQERRELLLARSERLRGELVTGAQGMHARLNVFDRGVALGRRTVAFGRSNLVLPLLVAGGVAILVARPSRWLRLASRALVLWPVVRPLLPHVARYARALSAEDAAAPRDPPARGS